MNNDNSSAQDDLNIRPTSVDSGTMPNDTPAPDEASAVNASSQQPEEIPIAPDLPDLNSQSATESEQPTSLPPISTDSVGVGTPLMPEPASPIDSVPNTTPEAAPTTPPPASEAGTPMIATNGYSSAPTHIDPVIGTPPPPATIEGQHGPDGNHPHSRKGKLKAALAALIALVLLIGIPFLALQLGVFRGDLRQRAAYEVTCGDGCVSGPNGEKKFCYNECIEGDTGYSRAVYCATGGYIREGRNCDTGCGATSCDGGGTGLSAEQVCKVRHGGTAGSSSTADPNCAANGGYSCDISGTNHCCYADASSTSNDGDCYAGGASGVSCSGNTITNNTTSPVTVRHYTGNASDNSCPISNYSGRTTTLAPGESISASGCEQIDAAGYCGVCNDSTCGGTSSSASSRASSSSSSSRSSSQSSQSSSSSSSSVATTKTWNITTVPVCEEPGGTPKPMRMFRIIWPKTGVAQGGWDCSNDTLTSNNHSMTVTTNDPNENIGIYVGLEIPTEASPACSEGTAFEPTSVNPATSAITFAKYMNPSNWMAKWTKGGLPNGNYTISFKIPEEYCNYSSSSSSSSSRSSSQSSSSSLASSSSSASSASSSSSSSSTSSSSSSSSSSQETLTCNKTCGNNSQCPSGTICSNGYCRNPECTDKTNCTCDGTAAVCNSSCGDNTQCPSGTFCSDGKCRNVACPSDTDCTCTVAPPTGIAASGTMPDAGVSLPGLAIFGAGLLMAILGILFAL